MAMLKGLYFKSIRLMARAIGWKKEVRDDGFVVKNTSGASEWMFNSIEYQERINGFKLGFL